MRTKAVQAPPLHIHTYAGDFCFWLSKFIQMTSHNQQASSMLRGNRKSADGANSCDSTHMGQGMGQVDTERITCLLLTKRKRRVSGKVTIGEPGHQFIHLCQQCVKRGKSCDPGRPTIRRLVLYRPVASEYDDGMANQKGGGMHRYINERSVVDRQGAIV